MRGDCLFCSYWWNRWQSLFKLSFYYTYDWHYNTNIAYTWLSLQYKKKIYLTVITIQKENISDCHYIQIYHISDCYHNTNIAYTCLYLTFITIQKENISDRHYNTERKYIWPSLQYKKKIYFTVIRIQIDNISDCHNKTNIPYIWLLLQYKYSIYIFVSDLHYNTNIVYI